VAILVLLAIGNQLFTKRNVKKPVQNQEKRSPCTTGSSAKVPRVRKAVGLIAMLQMAKVDIKPVAGDPVKKENDTLHADQPPLLAKKEVVESLGVRKVRAKGKTNQWKQQIYT
jgi:hypothetical protein